MNYDILFAGIAVADYPAARAWYERLFGRPADMLPHETEAAWHLSDTGWVYVVLDPERAGKGLLTLMVSDLDSIVTELEARGLATGPIETAPGAYRKLEIIDPDGNMVSFGQALSE